MRSKLDSGTGVPLLSVHLILKKFIGILLKIKDVASPVPLGFISESGNLVRMPRIRTHRQKGSKKDLFT